MRCPRCGKEEDRVIDSRAVRDGKGVRRRRECSDCGHRFTTYEYVEPGAFLVVKRDGRREAYQREKLRRGIMRACEKRPASVADIDAFVERIEARLLHAGAEEIATSVIGTMVLDELRDLDEVAYVRFASVYRRFDSVGEFVDIVKGMSADQSAFKLPSPVASESESGESGARLDRSEQPGAPTRETVGEDRRSD